VSRPRLLPAQRRVEVVVPDGEERAAATQPIAGSTDSSFPRTERATKERADFVPSRREVLVGLLPITVILIVIVVIELLGL
jgi:hypothetical protein